MLPRPMLVAFAEVIPLVVFSAIPGSAETDVAPVAPAGAGRGGGRRVLEGSRGAEGGRG